jgi:hypothetical protein
MELVIFYFGLAIVVGVAANTRGRSGGGWFLLSLVITPVITGLLVLALPRVEGQQPDHSFNTEAVLKGLPYRLQRDGTIQAMMAGGLVHFRDMEQFRAAAEGRDVDSMKAKFKAEFPEELNEYLYRIERDGSVSAVDNRGNRVQFRSWVSFRETANRQV